MAKSRDVTEKQNTLITPEVFARETLALIKDAAKKADCGEEKFLEAFMGSWWRSDMGGRAPKE